MTAFGDRITKATNLYVDQKIDFLILELFKNS